MKSRASSPAKKKALSVNQGLLKKMILPPNRTNKWKAEITRRFKCGNVVYILRENCLSQVDVAFVLMDFIVKAHNESK
ncbi:hypothetical protein RDI58_003375 [Solanum bulbocastanum]|uniref:Uncharacterized protein n=1 Tax=Solanum bulbocastanum TaxID=147425 RepID=A0AAN8YRU6_SOLBU